MVYVVVIKSSAVWDPRAGQLYPSLCKARHTRSYFSSLSTFAETGNGLYLLV